MKTQTYFRIYANCIPVRGKYRGIICDLLLERYRIIPNELVDVLHLLKSKTVNEVQLHFNNELNKGIEKYIDLLHKEDWGHWTDDPERFPDLNLHWDSPFKIQNCIIDISDFQGAIGRIEKFITQLNDYFCEAGQVRFFTKISVLDLELLMDIINRSTIRYLEIYLQFSAEFEEEVLKRFASAHPKLRSVIVYGSDFEKMTSLNEMQQGSLYFTLHQINSETHCGQVDPRIFNLNIMSFIESYSFNSCLNRKISMDKKGYIKNCPSMKRHFGSIEQTSVGAVLEDGAFLNYWKITKDHIDDCKDCEFRYICTDCRAYVEMPENIHSKPLKCGYNIETGTWEDWASNPLKAMICSQAYNINLT